MKPASPPRRLTTVDKVTKTVNQALGEQGCNYCQRYFSAERVRKIRNRFGLVKYICESCEAGRLAARNNGNRGNPG
jgi:hypothetical protein